MKKALVLLSGGPDSSTLAFWARREGFEVHTLTFNFGELEGAAERRSAAALAPLVSSSHRFVDFTQPLADLYGGENGPVHILRKVPDKHAKVKAFGAGIAIALGASHAAEIGADTLFYAVHKGDREYRENTEEFFELLSKAIAMELGKPFEVRAPFLNKTKAEVLALGEELGVPLEKTWSCALRSDQHCGTCLACADRKEAFALTRKQDLTTYVQP